MSLEFFAFFFLLGAIAVLMPPGIAILICFVVSTIAIAIFMAKSISIWFWFISGAIPVLCIKSTKPAEGGAMRTPQLSILGALCKDEQIAWQYSLDGSSLAVFRNPWHDIPCRNRGILERYNSTFYRSKFVVWGSDHV
jgi:energy-coupling factor transporter transmembrane protein EcfT